MCRYAVRIYTIQQPLRIQGLLQLGHQRNLILSPRDGQPAEFLGADPVFRRHCSLVRTQGLVNGCVNFMMECITGSTVLAGVDEEVQVARAIEFHWLLGNKSSVLITSPTKEEDAIDRLEINAVIEKAAIDAERNGVRGNVLTKHLMRAHEQAWAIHEKRKAWFTRFIQPLKLFPASTPQDSTP